MSKNIEKSEANESAGEKLERSKEAADDAVISGGASGKDNQKVHEKAQQYHHIEGSATDLLTPKQGESLDDFSKRSLEHEQKQKEIQVSTSKSPENLGLVDQEKKIVYTGSGILPLVPDDVSRSYAENLKAIRPAKNEHDLNEQVADATLNWMKGKGLLESEPQKVVEKHDDGSVLLKINALENVEANEDISLRNTPDGWLEAGRRIAELPLDKQFEIIGSGLAAGVNQYQHEENQRSWGRLIGTVQGIGEVSVNLAKIADFSAALILNDEERAGKMGAEFGQALGETIVGGVKLFNAADQYLFNIGFTGDYAKPFRDIVELGNAMNEKWESLPPKEQERIKFKLLTELGADTLIGGAGIHSAGKAGKFTEFLDDIAEEMAKQGTKTLEGAKSRAKAIKESIEDLMLPEAVTPDGQRIKIRTHRETPDNAVYSQVHNPDGSGRPHPDRLSESASGQPGDRTRHRESDEDIFKPRDMRAEIDDALEVLEQPLLDILDDHKVRIEIIETMEDAFPGDLKKRNFVGAYDWGRNTIFIPQKVMRGGQYIDNFDVDFAIRHEVGHVFNSKSLEESRYFYPQPKRISNESSPFLEAFEKDLQEVPDNVLDKLGFDKNTREGLEFARDEVFADTFAHATGFPTKNSWSILIRDHFPSCLKYLKEDVHGSFR